MTSPKIDAQMDERGDDPGQVGPDSGGQSGDTQGLSQVADAADESVEELADTGRSTRPRSSRAWRLPRTSRRPPCTRGRISTGSGTLQIAVPSSA